MLCGSGLACESRYQINMAYITQHAASPGPGTAICDRICFMRNLCSLVILRANNKGSQAFSMCDDHDDGDDDGWTGWREVGKGQTEPIPIVNEEDGVVNNCKAFGCLLRTSY